MIFWKLAKHLSTHQVLVTMKNQSKKTYFWVTQRTVSQDTLDFFIHFQDQAQSLTKFWIPTGTKLISCFFPQFLCIPLPPFLYVFLNHLLLNTIFLRASNHITKICDKNKNIHRELDQDISLRTHDYILLP